MLFEWDEGKRQANLAKHHIDFREAKRVFDGPVFERMDRRRGEDRVFAISLMEDIEMVVVDGMRGKRRRMMSVRRAHRNERQEHTGRFRSAGEGQN